jgi:hypothetical protein
MCIVRRSVGAEVSARKCRVTQFHGSINSITVGSIHNQFSLFLNSRLFSSCAAVQEMSITTEVRFLLQVNRLRPLHPKTCLVKIPVTWFFLALLAP